MSTFSLDAGLSHIRARLINDITSIILLLSILALAALMYNSLKIGWNISIPVQLMAATCALFICVFHKQMTYNVRAYALVSFLFLMGLACFLTFGISPVGIPFFILLIGVATLLWGLTFGCLAFAVIVTTLGGFHLAAHHNWITIHFDQSTYTLASFFWISILLAMGLWAGNILSKAEQLFSALDDALKAARRHAHEIFNQSDSLQKMLAEKDQFEDEINRLSERLQHPSKMEAIGTLASGISHDFNNIIASILALADLAKEKQQHGLKIDHELDKITNAIHRAQDLVKHIKTYSRQTPIKRSPLELAPLIHEAIDLVQATFPKKIHIRKDIRESCHTVMADPSQIHQILINLCTNALFAMKEHGGYLDIKLEEIEMIDHSQTAGTPKPETYVHLLVSDTGCGISEELIERIFTPFFTTKQNSEGTGMGLSVVHGIINDMGGSIKVYSKPGEGTKFELLFPVCDMQQIQDVQPKEDIPKNGPPIYYAEL